MELVEEAASYLDGAGRVESGILAHEQALAYMNESVQLTSRLMQIASWLLVQRALADGAMTMQEASTERKRLNPLAPMLTPVVIFDALPQKFREFSGLTARLYTRIQHLEELLLEADEVLPETGNPVAEQRWMIEKAFTKGE